MSDLPIKVQEDFRTIASIIKHHLKKDIDVYVFGSYFHGWWNDDSDYDIIIHEKCNLDELKDLFHHLDKKVDIIIPYNKIKTLLIT